MPPGLPATPPEDTVSGWDDLTPTQMQVVLKYLMGWPPWRIAMSLGQADPGYAAAILAQPKVKAAIAEARERVKDKAADIVLRLEQGCDKALNTVEHLMEHADKDNVKLSAAFGWLDRAGHKPVQRVEVDQRSMSASFNYHALPDEDRDTLRELALKAARGALVGDE